MINQFIALRYIRSKTGFAKVITWFSFIGIALGVATLIIVTSVMNGFRGELLEKIVGMNGHIEITSSAPFTNYQEIRKNIFKTLGEEIVLSKIEKQTVLIKGNAAQGVLVYGLTSTDLKNKKLIYANLSGDINKFVGNKIFLGKRLCENLNLKPGDKVTCLQPDGLVTAFGKIPKEEEFEVLGTFEAGMTEYDKNIIVMPLQEAQEFFDMPRQITKLEIFLKNSDDVSSSTKKLVNSLPAGLQILDWQHADSSLFHAVKVEKNVMSLILSIIILVATFNIISGLTMLTTNKTRDIGILRTVGITKSAILKIFLFIGSVIGIAGTTIGAAIGLVVALNISKIQKFLESLAGTKLFSEELYFLSQLPAEVRPTEVIAITTFALITCFLATLYPAIRASKLNPITAIQSGCT